MVAGVYDLQEELRTRSSTNTMTRVVAIISYLAVVIGFITTIGQLYTSTQDNQDIVFHTNDKIKANSYNRRTHVLIARSVSDAETENVIADFTLLFRMLNTMPM